MMNALKLRISDETEETVSAEDSMSYTMISMSDSNSKPQTETEDGGLCKSDMR